MKNTKKLFKNTASVLICFFLVCIPQVNIHAMKNSFSDDTAELPPVKRAHLPSVGKNIQEPKQQVLPRDLENGKREIIYSRENVPIGYYYTYIPPIPPVPAPLPAPIPEAPYDIRKDFNISFFFNINNRCKTLRIEPARHFSKDEKPNLQSYLLKEYLENHRQEILNKFAIVNPKFQNILEAFDVICINNEINTYPIPFLAPRIWLKESEGLISFIYVNKNHLEMRIKTDSNALGEIIFFCLYPTIL